MIRGNSETDVRRQLRELPRKRRRDVLSAIREGRAVSDPRDAAIAIAWAEKLNRVQWPGWLMPRQRPHGRSAWIWTLHLALLAGGMVTALVVIWSILPGVWRWVAVAFYAYPALTAPLTISRMLRMYWNAPAAERRNRELVGQS